MSDQTDADCLIDEGVLKVIDKGVSEVSAKSTGMIGNSGKFDAPTGGGHALNDLVEDVPGTIDSGVLKAPTDDIMMSKEELDGIGNDGVSTSKSGKPGGFKGKSEKMNESSIRSISVRGRTVTGTLDERSIDKIEKNMGSTRYQDPVDVPVTNIARKAIRMIALSGIRVLSLIFKVRTCIVSLMMIGQAMVPHMKAHVTMATIKSVRHVTDRAVTTIIRGGGRLVVGNSIIKAGAVEIIEIKCFC